MSNLEPRHGIRPAAPATRSVRTAHDRGSESVMPNHRAQSARYALRLGLTVLASSLCATAIAQQTPLTGKMLGGHTKQSAAPMTMTKPAPRHTQPQADHTARQPATTYPAASAHQPRQAAALPRTQAPQQTAASPAQPPMPAYTDLRMQPAGLPPAMTTPPPAVFGTQIGTVTHNLLRMQASNSHAVASLSTLGDEATAAYKRYIDSFNHPIPEFLKKTVKSSSGGGSQ